MAYSNTWSTSTPTEANQANALALYDRQTRLNLQERINSIIGVPIATAFADPIIPSTQSLTTLRTDVDTVLPLVALINQEYVIDAHCGQFYPTTYARPAAIGNFLSINQASHGSPNSVIYDLSAIPVGATLVDIVIGWGAPVTSNMTMTFRKTQVVAPGSNVPIGNTGAINGAGIYINTTLATIEVITTGFGYSVEILATLAAADIMTLGALKVRYTTANANIRR